MKKVQASEDKKKKLENFWYYYKFHVLIGAFLLICVIIFVRDMLNKVTYDYTVAFLGDYTINDEDSKALQAWFEAHGEDLNGDGEVHVQIGDYGASEDGDPNLFAAMQTKFTVDMQEGTSMIYFLSSKQYEKYKDMEIFPEKEEDYVLMKDCKGFQEAGNPASVGDMMGAMRVISEDNKLWEDEEIQSYYEKCEALFQEFVG